MIDNSEQLIQKAHESGFNAEKQYGGCGQCAMIGIFEALGIENPSLVKAGTGLAGGGGRMCDGVCGAYAGGIMAMSSIFGRRLSAIDGDTEERDTAFEMAVKLRAHFIKSYRSVTCGDIHKDLFGRNYNMWNQSEREQFDADGAHIEKCTGVVGEGAAAAVRIIIEEADKRGMTLGDIRKKTED